jgi:hypothetical protein
MNKIYALFLIFLIVVFLVYYMNKCNGIELFDYFNNSDIEIQIIDQLSAKFKIPKDQIKLYNILYDSENKVLDFDIEFNTKNAHASSSDDPSNIYNQLKNLIISNNFKLKINGNDVAIDKISKPSITSFTEKYNDPSQYEPKIFKEDIGYLENTIRGFQENKRLTNFWIIDSKTGKLTLPVIATEEEES